MGSLYLPSIKALMKIVFQLAVSFSLDLGRMVCVLGKHLSMHLMP